MHVCCCYSINCIVLYCNVYEGPVKVISSTVNGFVVFIIIYAAYVMYEVKYSSQMSYVSNYLYSFIRTLR